MQIISICSMMLLAGVAAAPLLAQTPNLSGTWQDGNQKWVISQDNNKIHVQEVNGDKTEADYTCTLDGQECKAKEDGKAEKIMMYFNGDKLVKICERGSSTLKQRLEVSSDGKTLNVETVPLDSSQRGETVAFHKQSS